MKLSENWGLEFDTYNVTLVCTEVKKKMGKDGEEKEYESRECFYFGTIEQALKSYVRKTLIESKDIQEVLRKISELDEKIEQLKLEKP